MTSKRKISDDDAALFRNAIDGVRELRDPGRHFEPPAMPAPRPRARTRIEDLNDTAMPDGVLDDAPGFADRQEFRRAGVTNRVWRTLRRGQLRVDDELDLHGMRVDTAREALARFLAECTGNDFRCVRVITGKGFGSQRAMPVLKAQVDRWLRLRPEVLGFCSTIPRDGGTGAVYVLLRHESPRR